MESFEAECQEKVRKIQKKLEEEMTSLRKHVRECTISVTI